MKFVQELSEVIGVYLAVSDISIAHHLPSTRKVKDRLIVKFNRRIKKQEIYASRKKLKSKRAKYLPSIAGNPIFQTGLIFAILSTDGYRNKHSK